MRALRSRARDGSAAWTPIYGAGQFGPYANRAELGATWQPDSSTARKALPGAVLSSAISDAGQFAFTSPWKKKSLPAKPLRRMAESQPHVPRNALPPFRVSRDAMAMIEIEGLRKEYRRVRGGRTVAVDGLDLSVPEGGVFGFLGPNGAGKTTTIRCLLGLVRPSSGRLSLLGADVGHSLPTVIGRVGSIVEAPAMFARFSGRRNLEILALIHGEGGAAVDASLERVGLRDRAKDPVKAYSLGMKQRLAIAATLLRDPSLLILDEPANGLDPAGIVEVRELLRSLGAEGRTIFVSSHILSEVQQTADHVAIVAKGKLIKAGPVNEVLATTGASGVIVKLTDLEAGRRALADAGIPATIDGGEMRADVPADQSERISRTLAQAGLYVTELRPDTVDLETVFLELTKDQGVGD
jgi:ABC-type multidrug transport system ATPase subunit